MNLAAEQNPPSLPAGATLRKMPGNATWIFGIALALALMATAANCFLKYLWWAACYSAWSGIPKLAEQWRAAGARATFNGWSVILLELASVAVLYSAIRLRHMALRVAASLIIAIVGSGLLALALAWLKQSH